MNKKSYGVACNQSSQCNDLAGLICPTLPNQCNCPFNTSAIFCDCPTGYYYDNTTLNCSKLPITNNEAFSYQLIMIHNILLL